jgi:two-component system, sensor histidine kinase and response regulator
MIADIPQTNRKKMLLINDDPKLLLGLKAVMMQKGYEVISTNDGMEGIQLAKGNLPDIIICGIMELHPNGFHIKRVLTDNEQTAEIPFIFLTSRSLEADKIAGLDQGADDYVTRPFNIDELVARIEAILRRYEIGRQRGRREMEAVLEKMRHSILTNLRHEFRAPLTVIMASMEMALRERFTEKPEDLGWYLESSLNSAQKLSRMVEDMILLNDIDQKNISSLRTSIKLNPNFMDSIYSVCDRYEQKKLNVRISIQDGTVIYAPESEFLRAVSQLVDNACKFSPDGAEVQIQICRNGLGGCLLIIENEGPSIPEKLRENVFERYYQIEQSDDRYNFGLGIGLTIAREIAQACGGNVVILDSEVGCKVQMTYPPLPATKV